MTNRWHNLGRKKIFLLKNWNNDKCGSGERDDLYQDSYIISKYQTNRKSILSMLKGKKYKPGKVNKQFN